MSIQQVQQTDLLAYDGGTGSWVASQASQDIILRNVDETTRDAIADVANGMVIYNTIPKSTSLC